MILLEACRYRSIPKVNMSNDRIRVTLTMSLNEWYIFKREHESINKQVKGEDYSSKEG